MAPDMMDLCITGTEACLDDAERLHTLGVVDGSVVFMLQRQGWRWDEPTDPERFALSDDGLVASKDKWHGYRLLTGGSPMTEGRHYWEVQLGANEDNGVNIGAVRPGLDPDRGATTDNSDVYFIYGPHSGGFRSFKPQGAPKRKYGPGDRIGVLLDLDAGWMRFYINGKRYGPGYTEGVTGPLVRTVQMIYIGSKVTALPGAIAPQGAGTDDEQLHDISSDGGEEEPDSDSEEHDY
jgi:hypothetical protein